MMLQITIVGTVEEPNYPLAFLADALGDIASTLAALADIAEDNEIHYPIELVHRNDLSRLEYKVEEVQ
jgi:hypothetical protein